MKGFFVPVKEVIALAQAGEGYETDVHNPLFYSWAYLAVLDIGIQYLVTLEKKLKLYDFRAEKPCGYVAPQLINLVVDGDDDSCVTPRFLSGEEFIRSCCKNNNGCNCSGETPCLCKDYTIFEDVSDFVVSTNATDFTHIQIRYMGIPEKDGQPMIPHYAVEAVEQYLSYRNTKRLHKVTPKRVSRIDVQEEERRWYQKCNQARTRMVKEPANLEQIATEWINLASPMYGPFRRRAGYCYTSDSLRVY